jgi:hypothetical protein
MNQSVRPKRKAPKLEAKSTKLERTDIAQMSLIVGLAIPDGLVIAGDSLATTQSQLQIGGELEGDCPHCHSHFKLSDIKAPPIPIALSVRSFAQKVFPFKKHYAIGTTGLGAINNKSIYYYVKSIEKEESERTFSGVTEVADFVT